MSDLTSFLSNTLSQGWLRDQQHASRLYRQDGLYKYSPKAGWMYYVTFQINPAIKDYLDPSWYMRCVTNNVIGQLVKSADLPKYSVTTETVNQYNRKTQVATKLEYQPISITFHDDMGNATNDLWFNYFNYTTSEGTYSKPSAGANNYAAQLDAYGDTKYRPNEYRYGFNPLANDPFFTSMTIYLMNGQKYLSFTLVNPKIKEWRHGDVDQTQGNKFLDSRMTVVYETVLYAKGKTGTINPAFNKNHYDKTPSPLSIAGGGASSLFGAGGVIAGGSAIFGEDGSFANANSVADYAKVGIQAANLTKNLNGLNKNAVISEITGVALSEIQAAAEGRTTENAAGLANFGIKLFTSGPIPERKALSRQVTGK